jgi:hypothetical protein
VSDRREKIVRHRAIELDDPAGLVVDLDDRRREIAVETDRAPGFRAPSRLRQGEPAAHFFVDGPQKENLHDAVLLVAAVETYGPDPNVVADEEIPRAKEARKFRERAVRDRPVPASEPQEPARSARTRMLGDELRREIVVEEIGPHASLG